MKSSPYKYLDLVLILIVLVLVIFNMFQLYQLNKAITPLVPGKNDNSPKEVSVDFYVMSYCPYGNQAEELLDQVYQVIGSKAAFNPHYVIYSNYGGGGTDYCMDNGNYCSMHGIQELNQDIREMCVNKYMGIDKYFEFIKAMNSQCNSKNADTCWTNVAKSLNLDTAKIAQCQETEGLELVKAEKALNDQFSVQGSPTVFINGKEYSGARSVQGFLTSICTDFSVKPTECGTAVNDTAPTAVQGGCG